MVLWCTPNHSEPVYFVTGLSKFHCNHLLSAWYFFRYMLREWVNNVKRLVVVYYHHIESLVMQKLWHAYQILLSEIKVNTAPSSKLRVDRCIHWLLYVCMGLNCSVSCKMCTQFYRTLIFRDCIFINRDMIHAISLLIMSMDVWVTLEQSVYVCFSTGK